MFSMPLVAFLAFVASANAEHFRNINWLGRGYDILKGNPHPTGLAGGSGQDLGWRFEIFDLNAYTSGRVVTIGDTAYEVPDGAEVHSCPVCSFNFHSTELLTSTDYKESLRVKVSTSFSGWGASFKASTDYRYVEERHQQDESYFMESRGECDFYCSAILTFAPPAINANFRAAVVDFLTAEYDEAIYNTFLDSFGTHYAAGLTMGGLFGVQHEITMKQYQIMIQEGLDIQASASYSALGFGVGVDVLTEQQKELAERFQQEVEQQRIYAYGGEPLSNGTDQGDTSLWYKNARDNPLPVQYSLAEISDLFTALHFPEHLDIFTKRSHINRALDSYCDRLEHEGQIECIDRPSQPVPSGMPDVIPIGAYGGGGGSEFDDGFVWRELGQPVLTAIKVRHGSKIDRLQALYGAFATPPRGGMGGGEQVFTLIPGERIVRIDICSGSLVDGLKFVTNNGRESPHFGGYGGQCRSVNLPTRLLYFSGRSASRLDRVTFHVYEANGDNVVEIAL